MAALGTTSSTTPVVINASDTSTVVLRNLHITRAGFSNATRGVEFNTGRVLHVENCVIAGFSDSGLRTASRPGAIYSELPYLFIKDSVVRGNEMGLYLTSIIALIEHNRMESNATGVWGAADSHTVISNSQMLGNSGAGLEAANYSYMSLDNCVLARNSVGIRVTQGAVTVSRSNIENGLNIVSGTIASYGNNRLSGGGSSFTSTLSEQ